MANSPSKFVWYELMTTDATAAEAFYSQVIGWKTQDSGMTDMRYTLLSLGETMIAGLMALPVEALAMGARPGWIGYVSTDDVDACAAALRRAGGAVHKEPADIPGVGRFAMVADPQGAVFAIFKGNSAEQPAQPAPGTAGTIGWHELHAGDGPSAFGFYSSHFGWGKGEPMDMGAMGTYQIFTIDGTPVGGMMTKMPDVPMPCWLYYINVDGIDAAISRVGVHGGHLIHGPQEVPGGSWIANCIDPQGAMFAMVSARR
jgi:hypothetical protein